MRSRQYPAWVAVVAVMLAAFGAYFNAIPAPFIFDDEPAIAENPTILDLTRLGTVLSPPPSGAGVTGRPVVNLSLAIDHALWGWDVRGYRATNIVIHALAGLTLFGLLRFIFARPTMPPGVRSAAYPLAGSVALLWLLHPLQTETVVCVIQRTESLVTLFYLLVLYAFGRASEAARPIGWLSIAMVAGVLGAASKEVMVTLPVVLILFDRTFIAGSFAEVWQRRGWWHIGLMLACWPLLGWLVFESGANRGRTAGFGGGVSAWDYLLTQAHAITLYLKLTVWPHPLVMDYGNWIADGFGEVALQFIFVAALFVVSMFALWRWPRSGFAAAVFFIVLSPSSSVVPLITQTIAEHRMYLPLAPLLALVVLALHRIVPRAVVPVTASLAVLGLALTIARNRDYQSELALWLDTVEKRPGSARAHGNLGSTYLDLGRIDEALHHYRESLRLDPGEAKTQYNIGLALERARRWEEAEQAYRAALAMQTPFPAAQGSLALVLNKLGRYDEALVEIEAALRQLPEKPAWHCVRGIALAGLDRLQEAVAAYRAALRLGPQFAEADANLGVALFRLGVMDDAQRHLERAVRLAPEMADAHFNLGQVAAAQGRHAAAAGHYADAVRRDPAHARAHLNLGVALARGGRLEDALGHLEAAVAAAPTLAEGHANLGIVLAELGRLTEAEQRYQEALRLRSSYAHAHYNYGNTLLRLGRLAEAHARFAEAVRLDPGLEPAQEMLRRLGVQP